MSAKYEASSPLTLEAGEAVASGLRGMLCQINATGKAIAAADATGLVVGTFAQDSMSLGEPVTVNQLQGKLQFLAGGAITAANRILYNASAAAKKGEVLGAANIAAVPANGQIVGVHLEPGNIADTMVFQGLAV